MGRDGSAGPRSDRRRFARRCTLAAVPVVLAWIAVGAGARPAAADDGEGGNTTPILECVWHDTHTGQYNSLWGYSNVDDRTDRTSIGESNNFSPSPQGRGQPTSFPPGRKDNAFVVTWNGSGTLTWNLENYSATATSGSKKCATNPVPLIPSPFAPWTGAVAIMALLIAGGFVVRWRLQSDQHHLA